MAYEQINFGNIVTISRNKSKEEKKNHTFLMERDNGKIITVLWFSFN
jgi:hypothetical protein